MHPDSRIDQSEHDSCLCREDACAMVINEYDLGYYYALKSEGRSRIVGALNTYVAKAPGRHPWDKVTICSINDEAIEYARLEWPKHYSPSTHEGLPYSWERLWHKFVARPSFFDLAIWQDVDGVKVLQGMALGKPSNGKTHLSINWVERNFGPTYRRGGILLPVLGCAEEYAKLLGCKRVIIKTTFDVSSYERYGYHVTSLKQVGNYPVKELSYGTN